MSFYEDQGKSCTCLKREVCVQDSKIQATLLSMNYSTKLILDHLFHCCYQSVASGCLWDSVWWSRGGGNKYLPKIEKHFMKIKRNKTQRLLCKSLARTIIPDSWSGLENSFTFGCGRSQQPFVCVLSHFRNGDKQSNNQPGDPSESLLLTSVRRQSFAILKKPLLQ